jgi:hypothetical protein
MFKLTQPVDRVQSISDYVHEFVLEAVKKSVENYEIIFYNLVKNQGGRVEIKVEDLEIGKVSVSYDQVGRKYILEIGD